VATKEEKKEEEEEEEEGGEEEEEEEKKKEKKEKKEKEKKNRQCVYSVAGAAAPEISMHMLLGQLSSDILASDKVLSLTTYAVCEDITIRLRAGPAHDSPYSGFKLRAGGLFVVDKTVAVEGGTLADGRRQLFLRLHSARYVA
jgi:hypothetical protein